MIGYPNLTGWGNLSGPATRRVSQPVGLAVQLRLAGRHWAGTLFAQGVHRILLDFFILALVLFAATTVYTVAGFGNALLAMPVMIPMLGIQTAAPTMGILSTVTFAIN
ncbi:MAG: hypothetical protein KDE09_26170, partial [Anaerolineales bacterium]|nr:hypothetical protein [Anaerolineales bacterium]